MARLTKKLYKLVCDTCGRVYSGHYEKSCHNRINDLVVCLGTLRRVMPEKEKEPTNGMMVDATHQEAFEHGQKSQQETIAALIAEVERLTAENAKYKVALSKIIKADWAGNCDDGYSVGHIAMAALAEAVRP